MSSFSPGGCGDGVFLFLEPASDWPGYSLLIGRTLEEITSDGDFDEDDDDVAGTGNDTDDGLDDDEGFDEDDDGLEDDDDEGLEDVGSFLTSAVSASHCFISWASLPFSLLKQTMTNEKRVLRD